YLYRIDDNYVQPFYAWAAPQLRDAAISGLYWTIIAIIDISLWLIDTSQRYMAVDAQAIALITFAQAHEPLPEFPALAPAAVPLALPYALPLSPAHIAAEDPWEVEAEYEFVEFSSSVAAQAIASPMLLLAPASTVVCGPVWNPAPKDIHTEVERLTRAAAAPAIAVDELTTVLDVPGATGQRNSRGKAKPSKGAAAKPMGTTITTTKTKRKSIVK
ncbi:MAG: hypothetical protein WCA35_02240, partial [Kovacikia sp.]